jgi:hypothetical protein
LLSEIENERIRSWAQLSLWYEPYYS